MPYLDHAATTFVRPEVLEAVEPLLATLYGNPSGGHAVGRDARRVLDEAREEIAQFCGASPQGVTFTSGGTEADNWVVNGVLDASISSEQHRIVITEIEHKAILEAAHRRERWDATVIEVGVDAFGRVDPLDVAKASSGATLVSVMAANNELGTIQDLGAIAREVRRVAPGAVLHTDAVQAAPWLDLAELTQGFDLLTLSSHKLGGLKGTGCLVARTSVNVAPLLVGGGQELGLRAGTQDAIGAMAMALALRSAVAERKEATKRIETLRDRFLAVLQATTGAQSTVEGAAVLPGHAHVVFPGMVAEELLVAFDRADLQATAGSSCASGATESSHVLQAIGLDRLAIRGAVRFTLGHTTTDLDIDQACSIISQAVAQLR
ncbi:MAG: cysteine desulfurase family protein [Actinomycetota bacterium]